jgi:leucyl aminopeptidase
MLDCFVREAKATIPLHLITVKHVGEWLKSQPPIVQDFVSSTHKLPLTAGTSILIPGVDGKLTQVLACVQDEQDYWLAGHLAATLPSAVYLLHTGLHVSNFIYAWGLGAYRFTRYKTKDVVTEPYGAKLLLANTADNQEISNVIAACYWVRDLINTPSDDMGPSEFAEEASKLANNYGATMQQIVGPDLLKHDYNGIYTVGRASDDQPRLLELVWGNKEHAHLCLVGKGVCFDSGGLDIKNSSSMLTMKKDMAGAAHVLALARLFMQAQLPIYLRVIIPLVENVISGNAYHPGDVFTSKKGLTVEVGNTDAEGRLILADALARAVATKPNLLIDVASLTGAARVALGNDIGALFTNNATMAQQLIMQGQLLNDPLWQLPLYQPYRELLHSNIADLNNVSSEQYGGAITAALFLQEFVPNDIPWIHLDIMAWNFKARHGRPIGGEAHGLRALYFFITEIFLPNLRKAVS